MAGVKIEPLILDGAVLVRPERRGDERGYLERLFCRDDFADLGLNDCSRQVSHVVNPHAGTLRGMHYQRAPHAEAKLIWVCRGAIFDVLVDLRPASPSHGRWVGVRLSEEDGALLYAPPGVAHGYLTLTDDVRMVYHIDVPYAPTHAAGVRFDDPDLAITWPAEPRIVADKDRAWPQLKDAAL